MGSLHVFESISVDGFFTDAEGGVEWAHSGPDAEFDAFTASNAKGKATLVFGRVTYDMMASWWPSPMAAKAMPDVAKSMNAARKIVFSRSMKKAEWVNTALVSRSPVEELSARKKKEDLVVLGSGSIVAQLATAGLVDSYLLVMVPIVLGRGRSLFEGVESEIELACTKTRAFDNGKIAIRYEPKKKTRRR